MEAFVFSFVVFAICCAICIIIKNYFPDIFEPREERNRKKFEREIEEQRKAFALKKAEDEKVRREVLDARLEAFFKFFRKELMWIISFNRFPGKFRWGAPNHEIASFLEGVVRRNSLNYDIPELSKMHVSNKLIALHCLINIHQSLVSSKKEARASYVEFYVIVMFSRIYSKILSSSHTAADRALYKECYERFLPESSLDFLEAVMGEEVSFKPDW